MALVKIIMAQFIKSNSQIEMNCLSVLRHSFLKSNWNSHAILDFPIKKFAYWYIAKIIIVDNNLIT